MRANWGAMVSTEVQRTLVKSPPELWTELSDPAALARHLEGLGEVTITALEPETRISWRAACANGTVVLKPSGWGTKVTLTVVRDAPEPATRPAGNEEEQPPKDAPEEPVAGQAPDAPEEAPPPPLTAAARFAPHHPPPLLRDAIAAEDPAEAPEAPEEEPAEEEEPPAPLAAEAQEPEEPAEPAEPEEPEDLEPLAFGTPRRERRGFFARLFARRRTRAAETGENPFPTPRLEPLIKAEPVAEEAYDEPAEPEDEGLEAEPEPTEDSVQRLEAALDSLRPAEQASPAPLQAPATEQAVAEDADAPDLAAELRAAEEAIAAESEAVLTDMLDRLGAAHHRPFSRA